MVIVVKKKLNLVKIFEEKSLKTASQAGFKSDKDDNCWFIFRRIQ